jgi:hypothetical protein
MVAVLCAACVSPAERSAQMQREVDEMIAVYGPACERLGYSANTDPYRDCVLRLNTRETIARYSTRPTTTTCFGHRGFFNCSTF